MPNYTVAALVYDITAEEARRRHETGLCVACSEPAEAFSDELSAREYGISGLCQQCQDQAWGCPACGSTEYDGEECPACGHSVE